MHTICVQGELGQASLRKWCKDKRYKELGGQIHRAGRGPHKSMEKLRHLFNWCSWKCDLVSQRLAEMVPLHRAILGLPMKSMAHL